MKHICIFLILISLTSLAMAAESSWNVVKEKHFLVYYKTDKSFAKKIGHEAEKYYRTISSDLGYKKNSKFWLWEKRASIYIYADRAGFVRATGAPVWAAGVASHQERKISTYNGNNTFIDSILPHELTHLIFREFLNYKKNIPLWLNEGIAQWEEAGKRAEFRVLVKGLYRSNRLVPLERLTNVRAVNTESGVRPEFYSDAGKAMKFYAQSVSVVGYLIEEHGSERFKKFCIQLRDGKNLDDALRFTYPATISSMETLEKTWKQYLAK